MFVFCLLFVVVLQVTGRPSPTREGRKRAGLPLVLLLTTAARGTKTHKHKENYKEELRNSVGIVATADGRMAARQPTCLRHWRRVEPCATAD